MGYQMSLLVGLPAVSEMVCGGETLAHLDYLLVDGLIQKRMEKEHSGITLLRTRANRRPII
jgi:hypothetical protein